MTVLCCRACPDGDGSAAVRAGSDVPGGGSGGYDAVPGGGSGGYDAVPGGVAGADLAAVLAGCDGLPVHFVGQCPGRAIDPLLADSEQVCVIGDDADLNAVVKRLLRKDLLGSVAVAYAPAAPTPFTRLYGLPTGAQAVRGPADGAGAAAPVPLVRNDAGGVLVGEAEVSPIAAPFYVDAERVVAAGPVTVRVRPDDALGLAVTVVPPRVRRRPWPRRTSRPVIRLGRAVEFGLGLGASITFDGITHPRQTNRWVFYAHTEPLLLLRPSVDFTVAAKSR